LFGFTKDRQALLKVKVLKVKYKRYRTRFSLHGGI
jgi:hypothetical protein